MPRATPHAIIPHGPINHTKPAVIKMNAAIRQATASRLVMYSPCYTHAARGFEPLRR